jgi:hypothetical protein
MTALEALAQMADSIGETQSAVLWRDRAEKMRKAIPARYLINNPKHGRVWTLDDAGWPNKSTVLGPLIFVADYQAVEKAAKKIAYKGFGGRPPAEVSSISRPQRTAMPRRRPWAGLNSLAFPFLPRS